MTQKKILAKRQMREVVPGDRVVLPGENGILRVEEIGKDGSSLQLAGITGDGRQSMATVPPHLTLWVVRPPAGV